MKFLDWLTLLFIALKLTGQITWPWIWVLSPLWIVLVSGIIVVLLAQLLK
jgi:uncharacterized membrane protein (DUF106 family)